MLIRISSIWPGINNYTKAVSNNLHFNWPLWLNTAVWRCYALVCISLAKLFGHFSPVPTKSSCQLFWNSYWRVNRISPVIVNRADTRPEILTHSCTHTPASVHAWCIWPCIKMFKTSQLTVNTFHLTLDNNVVIIVIVFIVIVVHIAVAADFSITSLFGHM